MQKRSSFDPAPRCLWNLWCFLQADLGAEEPEISSREVWWGLLRVCFESPERLRRRPTDSGLRKDFREDIVRT